MESINLVIRIYDATSTSVIMYIIFFIPFVFVLKKEEDKT